MNNIIHLIAKKVKREIEESVIKVLEGDLNLDNIVDSVGEMVNVFLDIYVDLCYNKCNLIKT